jgi:3-dehydroquinate dehydratase-2
LNILLIQGKNLEKLGTRQVEIYGTTTAAELDEMLLEHARNEGINLTIFYTTEEQEAIRRIDAAEQEDVQALMMNPAGFTDTAHDLKARVAKLKIPYFEVHLSNVEARKIESLMAEDAKGIVMGFGIDSYFAALEGVLRLLKRGKK